VVEPVWKLDDAAGRGREVSDVGRASALVVDDLDRLALAAKLEHRPDEVVPGRPEQPRRADDPAVPHFLLP